MVNGFIVDVSCLRQHLLPLNSIKRLKLKPLLRDWLVNQYNGKLVKTGKYLSYFISVLDGSSAIIHPFKQCFSHIRMWPDRVSNPGPLTYESGALPTALRGPALS